MSDLIRSKFKSIATGVRNAVGLTAVGSVVVSGVVVPGEATAHAKSGLRVPRSNVREVPEPPALFIADPLDTTSSNVVKFRIPKTDKLPTIVNLVRVDEGHPDEILVKINPRLGLLTAVGNPGCRAEDPACKSLIPLAGRMKVVANRFNDLQVLLSERPNVSPRHKLVIDEKDGTPRITTSGFDRVDAVSMADGGVVPVATGQIRGVKVRHANGVSDSPTKKMNRAEKNFCSWRKPWNHKKCLIAKSASDWAERAVAERFPGIDDTHSEVNAFRHMVWAATMAWFMSESTARGFLDRHEKNGRPGSDPDHCADVLNNERGIEIALDLADIRDGKTGLNRIVDDAYQRIQTGDFSRREEFIYTGGPDCVRAF